MTRKLNTKATEKFEIDWFHYEENHSHLVNKVADLFKEQGITLMQDISHYVGSICLYYRSDMSIGDISKKLKISENSVQTTLENAQRILSN